MYEIKRMLELSDAKAIITLSTKYPDIQASIKENSKIKLPIIIVNDSIEKASIPGTINLADLMRDDVEEFSVSQKVDISSEDTVLLPFSSGTTGLPKGVQLCHRYATRSHVEYFNRNVTKHLTRLICYVTM